MSSEIVLAPLTPEDNTELIGLAYNNDGNKNLTPNYINHWYYYNPTGYYSLWKAVAAGKIVGFATTNNFEFIINGKVCRVAMPQNVLTSLSVRGKGVFNKLYFQTETDNIENNKTDYFLTFTNKLSTPIFLSKFGYMRGICPPVILTFVSLLKLFSKKKYERITDINAVKLSHPYELNNGLKKSTEHMQWRYSLYSSAELHIISVKENDIITGYAFLKAEKKRGIRFLILMDIFCQHEKYINTIIDACHSYTSKNYFLFLMMFELTNIKQKRSFRILIKDRFNFLVKGKSEEDSIMLSRLNFNFFFGDMDSL